jgi:hypothetical protein
MGLRSDQSAIVTPFVMPILPTNAPVGPVADWTHHHPAADQSAPAWWRPVWHVAHLVYQAGVPRLRASSQTGGGFLPRKDFAGREAPMWQPYATPVSSQVGGGFAPSRPAFLQPLAGGGSTSAF